MSRIVNPSSGWPSVHVSTIQRQVPRVPMRVTLPAIEVVIWFIVAFQDLIPFGPSNALRDSHLVKSGNTDCIRIR